MYVLFFFFKVFKMWNVLSIEEIKEGTNII